MRSNVMARGAAQMLEYQQIVFEFGRSPTPGGGVCCERYVIVFALDSQRLPHLG
jgi:hypothetical protein